AEEARPGGLRALCLGVPQVRGRAGLPRGNRETRTRPAGIGRVAASAARRGQALVMTAADHALMARALRLAARGLATSQPNPRVGCVIARADEVVGEGWHQRAGGPHAEVHALQAAGERARGATVYVTLEPCSHEGRT